MIECKTIINQDNVFIATKYYYKYNKLVLRKKRTMCICGTLLLVFVLYLLIDFWLNERSISARMLFWGIGLIMGAFYLWYALIGLEKQGFNDVMKRQFKNSEEERVFNYTFTKEGINIEELGNTAFYKWSSVEKFFEESRYFIYVVDGVYNVIDKQGFLGDNQIKFKYLLKELKVPVNADSKR